MPRFEDLQVHDFLGISERAYITSELLRQAAILLQNAPRVQTLFRAGERDPEPGRCLVCAMPQPMGGGLHMESCLVRRLQAEHARFIMPGGPASKVPLEFIGHQNRAAV